VISLSAYLLRTIRSKSLPNINSIIIVTHYRYTAASAAAAAAASASQSNFYRDNFIFFTLSKICLALIAFKSNAITFFQLPQMLQMSSTRLHILSQHFSKTRKQLCPATMRKRTVFLSLCVLLISSNVTRKHWHRPQLEKKWPATTMVASASALKIILLSPYLKQR